MKRANRERERKGDLIETTYQRQKLRAEPPVPNFDFELCVPFARLPERTRYVRERRRTYRESHHCHNGNDASQRSTERTREQPQA